MNLLWLRNDLRLDDNPALYAACQQGGPVRAVYCATPTQWQQHNEAPVKLGFRSAALTDLRRRLAPLGIGLEVLEGSVFSELPQSLANYCQQQGVTSLYFNNELPFDEQRRDTEVAQALQKQGIDCRRFDNELLVSEPLLNLQDKPYRVFTPWYRAWLKRLAATQSEPLSRPAPAGNAQPVPEAPIVLPGSEDFRQDLWPANEKTALQRLASFTRERMPDYTKHRDFPAINATSTLSPYLASGLLSPRRCLMAVQQTCAKNGQDWRESNWLRELGWREFYRYLLLHFPELSQGRPFKAETRGWPWRHDPQGLAAWQKGQTGFPIIDAAMHQLLRTGWMHNRLRMLVASFLCKLLLVDWHAGEAFFMRHLIDGDFASNNGGWQWSAATGCDASPWFRIFNPTAQSQKFDPEGTFIRKMLPGLAPLDNKAIHNPSATQRRRLGYPEPIVDYKAARERALVLLKD